MKNGNRNPSFIDYGFIFRRNRFILMRNGFNSYENRQTTNQKSKLDTASALLSINSLLGSTWSPIKVLNI